MTNNQIADNTKDLITLLVENETNIIDKKEIVDNWYLARAYAETQLKEVLCRVDDDGKITSPLHVLFDGISPRIIAVIREIILRAHYIDFKEPYNGKGKKNQSLITILCQQEEMSAIKKTLLTAPFLGNYCKHLWGSEEENITSLDYLDVDIEIKTYENPDDALSAITDSQLSEFAKAGYDKSIDLQKAVSANAIYSIGSDLYNLPDINPTDIGMYETALNDFETESFDPNPLESWQKLEKDGRIKDMLSNVFCTDTFALRQRMLKQGLKDGESIEHAIEKHILEISRSEHSRWVAEKLIMDFRPWTSSQHYQFSLLFGNDKKDYRNDLKKQGWHYDLCSYHDLSRLDPQNRKFDTFLILAMPKITQNLKTS